MTRSRHERRRFYVRGQMARSRPAMTLKQRPLMTVPAESPTSDDAAPLAQISLLLTVPTGTPAASTLVVAPL